MTRSAVRVQADIDALREFADGYRLYYTVPDERGIIPVYGGDRDGLRRRIHRQLGRAEAAMKAANVNDFGVNPPPAIGGEGRRGLVATAFAYDEPQFQGDPPVYSLVLDQVELAVGVLEDELARTAEQRGPVRTLGHGIATAFRETTAAYKKSRSKKRFPRLLLERFAETVPKWAVAIERVVLFIAAVAAIVGTTGLIAGWWT